MQKAKYNLPKGVSFIKSTFNAFNYLNDPVAFITRRMDEFNGIYCAAITPSLKAIVTKDAGFISHLIKENHRNYKKSEYFRKPSIEFFGNGLLFSNGDYWLKQRRLIQPAFHKEKLQGLYELIIKTIDSFLAYMPTGDGIDIYPLMKELSFNIIINSLFDINFSEEKRKEIATLFTEIQNFFVKDTSVPIRRIFYLITKEKNKYLKKAAQLREIFATIINDRKQNGESKNDLLNMLLNSKYEDTGDTMTTTQILDEVIILIFAGHETTANTLSWLLYLAASNNSVQAKLNKSTATNSLTESLHNEYLKAAIYETMRLYPPAWIVEREAINDDVFKGYSYPKGTLIISFIYGLHHDKNFWENAEGFYPERFIEQPELVKSSYYYPFGAGPRMCIGNNFAMAEMSFFLHQFFSQFILKATSQIPRKVPLLTLRPNEVRLNIIKQS